MATVHFSSAAEADLISIGEYTLRNWGEEQAFRYLNAIEDCCDRLAEILCPAEGATKFARDSSE